MTNCGRLLLVKATCLLATALVLISVSEVATPSASVQFALYVADMTCACVRTTKQTKTIIASETESGKSIIRTLVLERSGGRLVLVANIHKIPQTAADLEKRFETISLRVEESAFKQ